LNFNTLQYIEHKISPTLSIPAIEVTKFEVILPVGIKRTLEETKSRKPLFSSNLSLPDQHFVEFVVCKIVCFFWMARIEKWRIIKTHDEFFPRGHLTGFFGKVSCQLKKFL